MKNSITEGELHDAKTFMKGNLALSYESIEVRMGQLAKNEMTFGEVITFDEIIDEINNITLDDFSKIASNILENKKFSLVSVGKLNNFDINKLDLQL